jgi:hypothetical protein
MLAPVAEYTFESRVDRVPDLQHDESLSSDEDMAPLQGNNATLSPSGIPTKRRRVKLFQKNDERWSAPLQRCISPRKTTMPLKLSPIEEGANQQARRPVDDSNNLFSWDVEQLQEPSCSAAPTNEGRDPIALQSQSLQPVPFRDDGSIEINGVSKMPSPERKALVELQSPIGHAVLFESLRIVAPSPDSPDSNEARHTRVMRQEYDNLANAPKGIFRKDRRHFGILSGRGTLSRESTLLAANTTVGDATHPQRDRASRLRRSAPEVRSNHRRSRSCGEVETPQMPVSVERGMPPKLLPFFVDGMDASMDQNSAASSELTDVSLVDASTRSTESSPFEQCRAMLKSTGCLCWVQCRTFATRLAQNRALQKIWIALIDILLYVVTIILYVGSIALMGILWVSEKSMLWLFNQPIFRYVVVLLVRLTTRRKKEAPTEVPPLEDDSARCVKYPTKKKTLWQKMKDKRARKEVD